MGAGNLIKQQEEVNREWMQKNTFRTKKDCLRH